MKIQIENENNGLEKAAKRGICQYATSIIKEKKKTKIKRQKGNGVTRAFFIHTIPSRSLLSQSFLSVKTLGIGEARKES